MMDITERDTVDERYVKALNERDEAIARAEAAEADNAMLFHQLNRAPIILRDKGNDGRPVRKFCFFCEESVGVFSGDKIEHKKDCVLVSSHPGSALLAELDALREWKRTAQMLGPDDDVRSDAATLRGYIKTHGETPAMTAAKLAASERKVVELGRDNKSMEGFREESETQFADVIGNLRQQLADATRGLEGQISINGELITRLNASERGRMAAMDATKSAHHELTTIHGLYACDGFGAYGDAQQAGADPNGAWDAFVESCFRLDCKSTLTKLEMALAAQPDAPEPNMRGE